MADIERAIQYPFGLKWYPPGGGRVASFREKREGCQSWGRAFFQTEQYSSQPLSSVVLNDASL